MTTNNDPSLAWREAARIGEFMWQNRELFQAELTSLDVAIAKARATDGLAVFSDAADATARSFKVKGQFGPVGLCLQGRRLCVPKPAFPPGAGSPDSLRVGRGDHVGGQDQTSVRIWVRGVE